MRAWLFRWHRRLAFVAVIPLLLWASSGLLHPLLSHVLTTQAARTELPATGPSLPAHYLTPAQLLNQHAVERFDNLRLVNLGGILYYQLIQRLPAEPSSYLEAGPGPLLLRYFRVDDGRELENGDALYALALARHYAGDDFAAVRDIQTLTHFAPDYGSINRLLPVQQVSLARSDDLQLFIHTASSRLAAVSDHSRSLALKVFQFVHQWGWLGPAHAPWRVVAIGFFAGAIALLGIAGLLLYSLLWPRKRRHNARWHRRMGLLVSLSLLGFSTSGLHQVTGDWHPEAFRGWRASAGFKPGEIGTDPLPQLQTLGARELSLARFEGRAYWQLGYIDEQGVHWQYLPASGDPNPAPSDAEYATFLARQACGASCEWVAQEERRHFGHDYPEVMKRLPVHKVTLTDANGAVSYFIETGSGEIAHRARPDERFRAMHFMLMHKYSFLNGLGLVGRDLIVTALALGILATAGLGLILVLRRSRGASTPN